MKKIVSLGEIMLRLTPPDKNMIYNTDSYEACYGGSESNVLVALAGFGEKTSYLTAIPDNDLGKGVLKHLHAYGVGTEDIIRRGDTLGMYFLEEGCGERAAKVIYHRKYSEVTRLTTEDYDYDKIFAKCDLFHISGISFALSDSLCKLCFRLIEEAKKRQIPVSFDFNYRSKLWSVEEASTIYREIVKDVDILFGSERDLTTFLGISKEEFHGKYAGKYLILRERTVQSDGKHKVDIRALYKQGTGVAEEIIPAKVFEVYERIGSGDAFVAGVLHRLLEDGENVRNALSFGLACFILKHSVKGDVFYLDEKTVEEYLRDLSKDVSR